MAGPWEKYSAPAPAAQPATGPWAKYAAPQPEAESLYNRNPVTGSAVYGAADLAAQGASRLAGKVASGVAGLYQSARNLISDEPGTPAADVVRSVQAAPIFNYEAQSPGAKTIQRIGSAVAKPFEAAAAPIDRAIENAGPAVSTFVPAASEAIQDVASVLPLGAAGRAAKVGEGAAAVEGAAKPSTAAPLETARSVGYQAPPSVVKASNPADAVPGRMREGVLGSSGIKQDAALQNQILTTKLIGEDIGLKDAKKITTADAAKFRETGPGPKYDAVAQNIGKITPDADAVAELERVASIEDPAAALPNKTATNVNRIVKRIQSGEYTGDEWRRDISWLRENKGREAANALEDMAERQLAARGDTATLQTYRGARQDFAKSYDVQDAIGRGGQIDAQHFRALDDKYPGLLSGNAKIVATAARELPEVTRLPGADTGGPQVTKWQAIHHGAAKLLNVIPGMNPMTEGFQTKNFGRAQTPTEESYNSTFGRRDQAPRTERPPPAFPEHWTTSPGAGGSGTPPGEGIPLADVLSTGVEQPPALGLSLAPMGRPESADIPFRVDPGHMAGDLKLAPEAPRAPIENNRDVASVRSQGVPEGIAARTSQRQAAPRSDTIDFEEPERLGMALSPGTAYEPAQRELPLNKPAKKGKKKHGSE